jgi:hypothetical protein
MTERPYIWIENGLDGRRRRWYPDEITTSCPYGMTGSEVLGAAV